VLRIRPLNLIRYLYKNKNKFYWKVFQLQKKTKNING
jgi:hypothetical protein